MSYENIKIGDILTSKKHGEGKVIEVYSGEDFYGRKFRLQFQPWNNIRDYDVEGNGIFLVLGPDHKPLMNDVCDKEKGGCFKHEKRLDIVSGCKVSMKNGNELN